MTHYYSEINSPLGKLLLTATERGLSGIYMEQSRHPATEVERQGWQPDPGYLAGAQTQLREYFAGARTAFHLVFDREAVGGTDFQRRVWLALSEIPYGKTVSYGELARRIGQPKAVRAVGLANGRNPLPIVVPCHRVIGASGTLTGYSSGLDRKRILLDLESGSRCSDPLMKPDAHEPRLL